MSVITTRTATTVLSILKSKDSRASGIHRVRFKLPTDVRKIFIDHKKGVSSKEYENLVYTIRDSEICDNDLLALLEEAKNCISLLNYDLRLFVQALVIVGWTYRSENVVQSYQEFFSSLVSAHSQHAKTVIDQLVKMFVNGDEHEWEDCRPSEAQERQFTNVHKILRSIVLTIPMAEEVLVASIKQNFPYLTLSSIKHLCYHYNVLKSIEYLPGSRREILQNFIDKLVNIDVNILREELNTLQTNGNQSGMFHIEEVTALIPTLDNGMMLLFEFINDTCRPDGGELRCIEAKKLFTDFMEIFNESIITVHGCEHVQFSIFYLSSFKLNLAHIFLSSLWKQIITTSVAPVMRKMAAAYLSSYLVRASFLPLGFLKTYLSEMTSWAHRYILSLDPTQPVIPTVHVHGVFYAVCQAIFYIIAFRHRDLVDSRKKLVFLQTLNLSKIVTCVLNPLQVCSTAVVENFAAVAKDYQLAYCYTVMEQNARNFVHPVLLEAIFPYDPYLLPKSSKFILPLYVDYTGGFEEKEMDVESLKTNVKSNNELSEEEDDDFIKDAERIKSQSRAVDIPYSSSPGFKPMSL